jgi:beta-phosphoglucomutase-like phosphatase (HAD superfamily)
MKKGFIFDVDGVIADTPHEDAWRESLQFLFNERDRWRQILERTTYRPGRFTNELYREQISGKARIEGARSALAYFHVPDPDGSFLAEYCDTKQKVYLTKVERGQFKVYDDAIHLLLEAKRRGIRILAASSSKNADLILDRISLLEWTNRNNMQFDSFGEDATLLRVIDGNVSGGDSAKSKPDPDIFLRAAANAKLTPEECLVVEDAVNGVRAAKSGHFFCIGIARLNNEEELREAKADLVTNDLRTIFKDILE